jgi:pilus assembly protein CpaF
MLGRRRSRSAPDAVDITERIVRRALDPRRVEPREVANSGNRFPPPRAAAEPAPAPSGPSAALLSFTQTPVYRLQAAAPVDSDELNNVLALLSDRLETRGPLGESRHALEGRIGGLIEEVLEDLKLRLTNREQAELIDILIDELIGLGPIEKLLADESVSEIIVNGPDAIVVERRGRRQVTDLAFRGGFHLTTVLERVAARAGRRFHPQRPIAGARIADGVRVDIAAAPSAEDWPALTLRKAARDTVSLDRLVRQGSLSADVAAALKVALRCRLNVVVSGVSGSGKSVLLRALSGAIDPDERVMSVADIGALRGTAAADMVTAMARGRDGVLGKIRAGRPQEALGRLESLVAAAASDASTRSHRAQVARAVDLIVQIARMADGRQRVIRVTEVLGLADDMIVTQDLFVFERTGRDEAGRIEGTFAATGLKPRFRERLGRCGCEGMLPPVLASRRGS